MFDAKFWEKYFKVYDVLNEIIPYRELMEELEKELDLKPNDIVLDVGSGTGNLMIRIRGKCKKVIGIDNSEEGLKIHKIKDSSAEILLHDITEKFPFPDNYFSKIVSNNTIYTLRENQQLAVLSEIYRVLKFGGKFVVSNVKKKYNPFSIYFVSILQNIRRYGLLRTIYLILKMIKPTIKIFYYNIKIKKSGIVNDYHFFEADEQKKILEEAGFKNTSETRYVFAGQAIMNSAYKL